VKVVATRGLGYISTAQRLAIAHKKYARNSHVETLAKLLPGARGMPDNE
jgi:hypothetical protein